MNLLLFMSALVCVLFDGSVASNGSGVSAAPTVAATAEAAATTTSIGVTTTTELVNGSTSNDTDFSTLDPYSNETVSNVSSEANATSTSNVTVSNITTPASTTTVSTTLAGAAGKEKLNKDLEKSHHVDLHNISLQMWILISACSTAGVFLVLLVLIIMIYLCGRHYGLWGPKHEDTRRGRQSQFGDKRGGTLPPENQRLFYGRT